MSRFRLVHSFPLSLDSERLTKTPRQLAFWIRLSPPFCQGVHHGANQYPFMTDFI